MTVHLEIQVKREPPVRKARKAARVQLAPLVSQGLTDNQVNQDSRVPPAWEVHRDWLVLLVQLGLVVFLVVQGP